MQYNEKSKLKLTLLVQTQQLQSKQHIFLPLNKVLHIANGISIINCMDHWDAIILH